MTKEGIRHQLDASAIKKQYLDMQQDVKPSDYPLLEGVRETLLELSKYHQLFIYTHRGGTTHAILTAHGLSSLFEEVITSEDGFERKPSPQALNYLVKTYSLDKDQTYYVGDRSLDIECGINAGLKTVYYGEPEKNHRGATHCIHSFSDLLKLVV